MKTLSRESFRTPIAKILAGVFLASNMIIVPVVLAHESLPDVVSIVSEKLRLSKQQINNLMLAKQHATESKHPEAIQALMLKESNANTNVKSVGNCHGILQIMTSTAQSILKADAALRAKYFGEAVPTKAVVVKQLKTDVVFSIEIADRLLAKELNHGVSLDRAILSYNRGSLNGISPRNSASKYPYVKAVMKMMTTITEPMNELINNQQTS